MGPPCRLNCMIINVSNALQIPYFYVCSSWKEWTNHVHSPLCYIQCDTVTIQARKLSSENLAGVGGGKESPVGPGPVRATSLEDIPSFASHSGSRSVPSQRIVDAVVKLYVPDHTYKYLDISPVSVYPCN